MLLVQNAVENCAIKENIEKREKNANTRQVTKDAGVCVDDFSCRHSALLALTDLTDLTDLTELTKLTDLTDLTHLTDLTDLYVLAAFLPSGLLKVNLHVVFIYNKVLFFFFLMLV